VKQTFYIETSAISYLTVWQSRDWWQNERTRFELFASLPRDAR